MCSLHDFLSSKIRFIHTSTYVTGSHSCSGKKYAYASRTSCLDCYARRSVEQNEILSIPRNQNNNPKLLPNYVEDDLRVYLYIIMI